jgi:hypothetical protein
MTAEFANAEQLREALHNRDQLISFRGKKSQTICMERKGQK